MTALKVLAVSYRGLKQPEQAAKTLQTAVSLIETVPTDELDGEKRATYLATQHSVFAELTDLYASDDKTTSLAFVTSERGRARSLRYAASQTQGDTACGSDDATYSPLPADAATCCRVDRIENQPPGRARAGSNARGPRGRSV